MARTVSKVLAAALVIVGFTVTGAVTPTAPAGAHARVVGTVPENHTHLEESGAPLPAEVSVLLASKPATVEGDPLRVYGPTGERVDAGDVRLKGGRGTADDPAELTVSLDVGDDPPTGEYNLVWRVVSADTHLVAGRIMFHYGEADNAWLLSNRAPSDQPESLVTGWATDPANWPQLLFVLGILAGIAGAAGQRRRRLRRDRDFGARVLSAGLVSGRRLD